jgi:hypothetical protein
MSRSNASIASHLLSPKILHARSFAFRFPVCLPSLPHLPLGRCGRQIGDCPTLWQLSMVNGQWSMVYGLLVNWSIGLLVYGQLVYGQLVYGQ